MVVVVVTMMIDHYERQVKHASPSDRSVIIRRQYYRPTVRSTSFLRRWPVSISGTVQCDPNRQSVIFMISNFHRASSYLGHPYTISHPIGIIGLSFVEKVLEMNPSG